MASLPQPSESVLHMHIPSALHRHCRVQAAFSGHSIAEFVRVTLRERIAATGLDPDQAPTVPAPASRQS